MSPGPWTGARCGFGLSHQHILKRAPNPFLPSWRWFDSASIFALPPISLLFLYNDITAYSILLLSQTEENIFRENVWQWIESNVKNPAALKK